MRAGLNTFRKFAKVLQVQIHDTCIIEAFAKTCVIRSTSSPKTSLYAESNIVINSLSGKTLDKYRELYGIIVDLFNLFSSNDIDLVSITGFYEEPEVESHECSMMGHVRIIYHRPILANLRKPANNINFANRKYCLWIPKMLSEWFDLVLSKGFEEVINLYFAVMVSPVDCFLEFQFLALAQALEVYHKTSIGTASKFRKQREVECFSG